MTIAIGQNVITQSPTSGSATTSSINTASSGSTFVVYVVNFPQAGTITVSDNKSNTYTQINSQTNPSPQPVTVALFYKENGAGGSGHTFTATNASGTNFLIIAVEVTGGASSILDTHPTAVNDTSSPYTSNSTGTLSQASELALAFATDDRGGTTNPMVWGGGFTGVLDAQDSNNVTGGYASQITSTTSALTSSLTISSSTQAESWVITLKDAGSGTVVGPGFIPGRGVSKNPLAKGARNLFTPRQLSAGTDVTVALTGVSASFSTGILVPSGGDGAVGFIRSSGPGISPDYKGLFRGRKLSNFQSSGPVTVALTGQQANFSTGVLTPNTTVPITGIAGTFSAGTLTPTPTIALTGIAAAFSTGALAPGTSITLSGQAATFSTGVLTSNISVALLGQAFSSTTGVLVPVLSIALSGNSATITAGNLVPSTSVQLTGQPITISTGTMTSSGGDLIIPSTTSIVGFICNVGTYLNRQ